MTDPGSEDAADADGDAGKPSRLAAWRDEATKVISVALARFHGVDPHASDSRSGDNPGNPNWHGFRQKAGEFIAAMEALHDHGPPPEHWDGPDAIERERPDQDGTTS